jgi:hypothetical protein
MVTLERPNTRLVSDVGWLIGIVVEPATGFE